MQVPVVIQHIALAGSQGYEIGMLVNDILQLGKANNHRCRHLDAIVEPEAKSPRVLIDHGPWHERSIVGTEAGVL